MARKRIKKCSFAVEYRKALRQMIRDAREITGEKRVPKHLRTAAKSHAEHRARVVCNMKKYGVPYGFAGHKRSRKRGR